MKVYTYLTPFILFSQGFQYESDYKSDIIIIRLKYTFIH